jgi:hypothetical protein
MTLPGPPRRQAGLVEGQLVDVLDGDVEQKQFLSHSALIQASYDARRLPQRFLYEKRRFREKIARLTTVEGQMALSLSRKRNRLVRLKNEGVFTLVVYLNSHN